MVNRPHHKNVCEFSSQILIIANRRKMETHAICIDNSLYIVWGYVEQVIFAIVIDV